MKHLAMPLAILPSLILGSLSAHAQEAAEPVPAWQKTPLKKEGDGYLEFSASEIAQDLGDVKRPGLINRPLGLDEAAAGRIQVITFRKPRDFDYEFAMIVVDGKIQRAFVVSTAGGNNAPIRGFHRLVVPRQNGKPWPWRKSLKYEMSPMYWALQIHNGFFIHSSPHYGNLGVPASKGCVRTSLPDAMELFDLVVNKMPGVPAYSLIFEGADAAGQRVLDNTLKSSGWTVDQLKQAIARSKSEVGAVTAIYGSDIHFKPGVPADAHLRPKSDADVANPVYPSCGGLDCWTYHGKPKTSLYLKPRVISSAEPAINEYSAPGTIALKATAKAPQRIRLSDYYAHLPKAPAADDVFNVTLRVRAEKSPLSVRVCDTKARVCSIVKPAAAGKTTELEFSMWKLAGQLKSSSDLILEVKSGEGALEAATVRYYQ